jgi:hypothetical protein
MILKSIMDIRWDRPFDGLTLHMSVRFAAEGFIDGRPSSSLLVYFSGILGLSEDGRSWDDLSTGTQSYVILSALIHQQRLLFLKWVLLCR